MSKYLSLKSYKIIIIIIITGFYIVLFISRSKHFQWINTLVIGFRINSALRVHFLYSLRSILASRHFTGVHMPTHHNLHPTGSPFIHLGREQQSGWSVLLKDKSIRRRGNRTRALSMRVEWSHHYTTAPQQCLNEMQSIGTHMKEETLLDHLNQVLRQLVVRGCLCFMTHFFWHPDTFPDTLFCHSLWTRGGVVWFCFCDWWPFPYCIFISWPII